MKFPPNGFSRTTAESSAATSMVKVVATAMAFTMVLSACSDKPARDPQADSILAAAQAKAQADSLDAIALVAVDTAIAPSLDVNLSKMTKTPSGLYWRDRKVGTGAAADSNKWVLVDYTTWLTDGTVLDDTRKKGREPRRVLLGHREVVAAWDEALRGLREGGRRIIVAPPSMAYGKAGKPGSVPRLATLIFDVEMKKVY